MTDPHFTELIGVAPESIRVLASQDAGTASIDTLREAGYAGGRALRSAFGRWLIERSAGNAEDLSLDEFSSLAAEFFSDAGWGRLSLKPLHDALAVMDIDDCWEAREGASGCHITTGSLAGFLATLTDYPVAVMEVECGGHGGGPCRFLAGNDAMMHDAYERISAGERWETIGAGDL